MWAPYNYRKCLIFWKHAAYQNQIWKLLKRLFSFLIHPFIPSLIMKLQKIGGEESNNPGQDLDTGTF